MGRMDSKKNHPSPKCTDFCFRYLWEVNACTIIFICSLLVEKWFLKRLDSMLQGCANTNKQEKAALECTGGSERFLIHSWSLLKSHLLRSTETDWSLGWLHHISEASWWNKTARLAVLQTHKANVDSSSYRFSTICSVKAADSGLCIVIRQSAF